jgi:hypothetical protein
MFTALPRGARRQQAPFPQAARRTRRAFARARRARSGRCWPAVRSGTRRRRARSPPRRQAPAPASAPPGRPGPRWWGMPSLRTFPDPPGLGILRSRTGSGRNAPVLSWARRSSRNPGTLVVPPIAAAVRPSTPGVFAPALPATRAYAMVSVAGSCPRLNRSSSYHSASRFSWRSPARTWQSTAPAARLESAAVTAAGQKDQRQQPERSRRSPIASIVTLSSEWRPSGDRLLLQSLSASHRR